MKTLVTGDFILDYHILKGTRLSTSSPALSGGTQRKELKGGAYLTYELLNETINGDKEKTVKEINRNEEEYARTSDEHRKNIVSDNNEILQSRLKIDIETNLDPVKFRKYVSRHTEYVSYIEWDYDSFSKKWNNKALGYGHLKLETKGRPDFLHNAYDQSDLIIIDEANLGFRDLDLKIRNKTVILKMAFPFCEGRLWKNLKEGENTLYTIVTLENLRKYDVKVSKAISWEQTALDLAFELTRNTRLKELLKSRFLIVLIGSAGALCFKADTTEENSCFELIFDPEFMEDEWEQNNGNSLGAGSAFAAGFSRKFILGFDEFIARKNIDSGNENKYGEKQNSNQSEFKPVMNGLISAGLNHIRILKESGLIVNNDKGKKLCYPIGKLSEATEENPCYYSSAFIPSPYWHLDKEKTIEGEKEVSINYLKNNKWTILENNYRLNVEEPEPFYPLARDIAYGGPGMAQYAPRIEFAKFLSLDRSEIESLRNIKQLVLDYNHNQKADHPLNIAVFGAPGAGKSFAVKQLAFSILGKEKVEFLEYNLSQFINSAQLPGAFHTVRDAVLRGKLPFVFWDEFDSVELMWLKELIAPMQDGKFLENGVLHPLGKCVFIFAGGTSNRMEEFDPQFFLNHESEHRLNDEDEVPRWKERVEKFKMMKGPDFLSRINGYLNVQGPNKQMKYSPETREWIEDNSDVSFPVRRALFLRGVLGLKDGEKLNMDWGLVSALLELSKYIRGSRSMERLVSQLTLRNKDSIIRSNLPSDKIIAMNVDFPDFMEKLYKDRKMEQFSETLAVNIHNTWMKSNVTDSTFFNGYKKLNFNGRKDNIAAAKRIFTNFTGHSDYKLDLNYEGNEKDPGKFLEYIEIPEGEGNNKNLEELAELEHNGWMKEREKAMWTKGFPRNDYLGIHPSIKSYSELDEKEKEKDRISIRNYVDFLNTSAFRIVKK